MLKVLDSDGGGGCNYMAGHKRSRKAINPERGGIKNPRHATTIVYPFTSYLSTRLTGGMRIDLLPIYLASSNIPPSLS